MSDEIPSILALEAEMSRRSLRAFLEFFAWPVLQPATPFRGNWHIDAICDHLQAVKHAQIRKLLVNMPFRMLKSTIISQAFPVWDWIDNPSREFLTASYASDVAMRDAVESRRIIESPKFQAAFGRIFKMASDQNVKTRYENDRHGKRIITATGAAGTGFGGDIRITDDPISAREADSIVAIKTSVEWWKGTMSTRANDPGDKREVIVHQRMNADDLTGYILTNLTGWDHLILPFRYDPKLRKTTSIGFNDPRKIPGELIHPARVNEEAAKDLESTLGSYHKEAQLQQNPAPRGGIIFNRAWWNYWGALPEMDEIALSVDCTFKDAASSDNVAIQAWGCKGANNYLMPGRIKEKLGFNATVQALQLMVAQIGTAYPGKLVAVLIEDKANGSAVIETLQGKIPGVIAIEPEGGKAARAYAMQPTCEAGNMWLPSPAIDSTIGNFVETSAKFTGLPGGDDDEQDAMTQYVNWRRRRSSQGGLAAYMEALAGKKTEAETADAHLDALMKAQGGGQRP